MFDRFFSSSSKEAVIAEDRTLSFSQLQKQVEAVILQFKDKGLKANDRIIIKLHNGADYILAYLACLCGEFSAVPINMSLPKNTIDFIVNSIEPNLIIEGPSKTWDKLTVKHSHHPTDKTHLCIFYTSGTTSLPKGVCHRFENFITNAKAFNELVGINQSTRMLHVLPMGYMAGFLNTIISPLVAGGSVAVAPQFQPATAVDFWDIAKKYNINAVWLSPTMLAMLNRIPYEADDLQWVAKNLKHVLVGTAPLPTNIKNEFEDKFKVECLESYGISEAMLVSGNSIKYPRKKLSVGRVIKDTQMTVVDDDGRTLAGAAGNIKIKSPYLLAGYFDPKLKTFAKRQDEWFDSGDCGYVDKDGDVFITGRKKDIIIHGGINVSPKNVEEVIGSFKNVKDVAVIGKPHEFWGEEVVAFVIAKDGMSISIDELKKYCREHLHPDAVPSQFQMCQEFPRSSMGKVQKYLLKEELLKAK